MSVRLNAAQSEAVLARDRDLCVEAGAGTGKTRVLTERIVRRVVDEGADLSRVLAITFTDKAAQEMKARLASALLAAGRTTAREDVEAAPISTVHAFCARLLRDHAVEAGLDPGFAVLDEIRAERLLRDALDELVTEWLATRPGSIDVLADLPGADPADALLDVYRVARGSGRGVGAFVREVPGGVDVAGALGAVREALRDAAAARGDASKGWQQRIDAAVAAARGLPDGVPEDVAEDSEQAGAAAAAIAAIDGAFNMRGAAGEAKDAMAALRDACGAASAVLADLCLGPLRDEVAAAVERLEELHRDAKGGGAALDFADLERCALDLLEARDDVREAVRQRYAEVLVDEFQDTNPVQARLLDLVRNPGRLFVVGDPKQSIYGFRGADVEVFLDRVVRVRAETGDGAGRGVIPLTESYRARPQVTGFVNRVFAGGVSAYDKASGVRGVPYEPLVAPRAFAPKTAPCVEVLAFTAEDAQDARLRESAWIADRVVELASGEGGLRVAAPTDDDPLADRPAGFGDVAILLRATTNVKKLEDALVARDVPYLVLKGRGFYDALEVVDMANLLGVIDDPTHDIRLAAVLRSPCCGIGDDTLFALSTARPRADDGQRAPLVHVLQEFADGRWRPDDLDHRDAGRLRDFVSLLSDLRAARASESLAVLVDVALQRTDLEARVLAQANGRQRAANLRKVREMALAADAAGDVSLGDLALTLRDLRQREVRETEAPVAGAAHGAVSILTVHAAKGLEFPIVFVPDLAREAGAEGGALVVHVRDGVGWKGALGADHPLVDVAPASHTWIKERNRARARAEDQRLLYVALTRAEEHLVVTAAIPGSRRGITRPWWERIEAVLPAPFAPTEDADAAADAAGDVADGAAEHAASLPRVVDVGPGADARDEAEATSRAEVLLHPPVPPALDGLGGMATGLLAQAAPLIARGRPVGGEIPADSETAADALLAEAARVAPAPVGTLYLATVSALVAFDRCPEEFRRRHILGIPESLELALALDGEPGETPDEHERPGDDDEWGLPLSTRALGRAAHLALETLAPGFEGDVTTIVREALSTETGGAAPDPEDVERLVGWVHGFAASDLGRSLRGVPRAGVRREQAVLLRLGRTVIRGQIDLLFRDDDGWTLVDYKAGRLGDALDAYAVQMRLYALAIRGVVGELPRRTLLWSLPEARAVDISAGPEELAALESGLLAEFERRTRDGDLTPGPDRPCGPCPYNDSCGLSLTRG